MKDTTKIELISSTPEALAAIPVAVTAYRNRNIVATPINAKQQVEALAKKMGYNPKDISYNAKFLDMKPINVVARNKVSLGDIKYQMTPRKVPLKTLSGVAAGLSPLLIARVDSDKKALGVAAGATALPLARLIENLRIKGGTVSKLGDMALAVTPGLAYALRKYYQ